MALFSYGYFDLTEKNVAKIWYSALKIEHKSSTGNDTLMAGSVFSVKKHSDTLVCCTELYGKQRTYFFTADYCRSAMTKPSVDLDSVMEESFMLCEAAYC